MSKCYVFNLPNDSTDMIHTFNLKLLLENTRTSIYQNESARFSIDSDVVRILLYNNNDKITLEKVRNYFYGAEYEQI